MEKPSITTRMNGPYLVKGPVHLIDAEGKEFTLTSDTIALCRCGHSANKPFCDGTHNRRGSRPPRRPADGGVEMSAIALTSRRHRAADDAEAIELCFARGWTDGLPVIPPTPERVARMLEAARLEPAREITYIAHRAVSVTAEKVAINAVMAGCRPEYMPVVVAAIEGIGDPRWSYHGPGTSTAGAAVLLVVNGPIARALDVNAGDNLFGPGWRANLTIGRAVRLVMRNVCGSRPGTLDRGTLGHPGKLSYVIAENEAESPWPPLHVERGFRPDQSAVTVMAAAGPRQFYNQLSNTAEGVLTTLADDMRISGNLMGQPQLRRRAGRRAHADDRRRRLDQADDPRVPLRAHEELARPPQADASDGRSRPAGRRGAAAAPGRVSRRHPRRGGRRPGGRVLLLHPGLGRQALLPGRDQGGQAMIEVLDPTVEVLTQPIKFVARPGSLAGKRVGLVENTKFNSDRLLQKIGDILVAEHGAADARLWRKHNASVPAHDEIVQEIKATCDVMVAGIGD